MKKTTKRIIMFILTVMVIAMLFYLIKDQIIQIIKLAKENRKDDIKALIYENGIWGVILVILIEAIQMVVVVIPAEFVQLSAGISYPYYLALSFCLMGVFLGATIIYLLSNYLKFDRDLFGKASKKINSITKQKKANVTTQLLMYLLFIMPIIPFGAICYYGSSSKMSYRRYIITCVTGVIPSILTSIIMGNAIVFFTAKGASLWLIILVIIGLAAVLFSLVTLIIRKYFFDEESNKGPNPIFYSFFYNVFKLIVESKLRVKVQNEEIAELDGPMIVMSNHQSFYDFYHICKYIYPSKATIVGNKYYFRFPFARYVFKHLHVIPKTLFCADIKTVKSIFNAINNKQIIALFPEGRLCNDGKSYEIIDKVGSMIKHLNVPLVLININGAYATNPKWSNNIRHGKVDVYTKRIIMPEELEILSINDIDEIIAQNLFNNEYEYLKEHNYKYNNKRKAEDIAKLIYYCPHCHKLYTISGKKNIIECNDCHLKYNIMPNYQLVELSEYKTNINDLVMWYDIQKEYELNNIKDGIELTIQVDVKIISFVNPKLDKLGKGVCCLTNKTFTFIGDIDNKEISFNYEINKLRALPFSGNEEFECYYENELYYFYPTTNRYQVVRWALLVDLLYKENNN